jgi:hypothetical protein
LGQQGLKEHRVRKGLLVVLDLPDLLEHKDRKAHKVQPDQLGHKAQQAQCLTHWHSLLV